MYSTRIATFLVILSLLVLVVSKCNGEGFNPPLNCVRDECPAYTVVDTEEEFEIRTYEDAQWLSGPSIPSPSYELAATQGFLMLLGYINGENGKTMRMNMTSPVLIGVENSTYTVYYYLPKKYQKSAPQPLTNEIREVKLPGYKYAAVRRFDGIISDVMIPIQVDALKKSLKSSADYQRAAAANVFMLAAYDSPFQLINTVNEVFIWFN